MENFNKNNPTLGWTEDEQYDFGKMENQWLKELTRAKNGKRAAGVARLATEPTFSTVEDINISFESDILERKETWKHLCHICDYATNRKECLTNHFAVHGIGDRFKCDQCDKDFPLKCNLLIHMKSHNSCPQKCNQCGKMYKTAVSLKRHIAEIHSEKRLECDECYQLFSTSRTLNHHKKFVHVLKSFKCDQCKYRSKTASDLKKHINTVHNVCHVFFKCDLCDFQGKAGSIVKMHKELVHEKKKIWFCKACPYSAYHKEDFVRHMEFTLAKNRTNVSAFHRQVMQTSTVKK